jgi:hypothetical protein
MHHAVLDFMDKLSWLLIRHERLARVAWLALALVLVACNDGNSGGDGGGY